MNSQNNKWTAVDANAFLHCRNLLQLGVESVLCTTSSVLNELKDQKTKDIINALPFQLKVELASQNAMKAVKDFASKTGDIVSLSDPDLEIIAIAYDECLKRGLASKLNKEPKKLSEPVFSEEPREQDNSDDYSDQEYNNNSEGEQQKEAPEQVQVESTDKPQTNESSASEQPKPQTDTNPKQAKEEEVEPKEDDGWIVVTDKRQKPKKYSSGDDDEWITPENYAQKKLTQNLNKPVEDEPEQEPLPVFVMTSDFSMQNVILQMGIGLRSVQGLEIHSVKRFIMECYACWAQYTDFKTNKVQICSKCGYNTLSKVAFSIDSHGNRVLHRKRNWKPNQKIREWKDKKLLQQQRLKKNQRERKTKKASIFA